MKVKNLAFLYNVRHHYPDPNDDKTQLEVDFDDPETTRLQIKYLHKNGFKVFPIEANEKAYLKLYKLKNKIDFVFNLSEGLYGKDREAQIPAILEMLQIPYTGSSPLTQGIVLNKARAKEIFFIYKIPTLPFQVVSDESGELTSGLHFPLIVKPISEGSSAGINNKSVVKNKNELKKQIRYIKSTFREASLIEPYLKGREFSVAMLGNPPEILPIIESDHSLLPKKYLPFDSLEVKWFYELETSGEHLKCPANISAYLQNKLEKICLGVWRALDIYDWCRIDIRCDNNTEPFVLEVNSPPGCTPPEHDPASYFPLAARVAGIEYGKLLKRVIDSAIKRYK